MRPSEQAVSFASHTEGFPFVSLTIAKVPRLAARKHACSIFELVIEPVGNPSHFEVITLPSFRGEMGDSSALANYHRRYIAARLTLLTSRLELEALPAFDTDLSARRC